ncbi:Unknown protein sequence [Pseudomonas savastanoi pv. phaseolicola]|nr:Unknown protein sequence [Pseudomonas savastanoi pv. phaseolicola]KPB44648.1 Unknown protein sequence [Pseudomonas savastanoi pv. phaseolicola]KPB48727.1 Unknown protein sequence [Pseudomonas savastanoi pv. phaseolicola]KPB68268.1 Unknown protein sequence [Pseudomonas amygdali pv. mellea]
MKSRSNLTLKDENVPMKNKLKVWLSLAVFFTCHLPAPTAPIWDCS